LPRIKRAVISLIRTARAVSQKLEADRIQVYAAQASFFLVISAVPLIILIISLFRYILPLDLSVMSKILSSFLPDKISDFSSNIITEIYDRSNISAIPISALAIVWAASKGMKSIGAGVRNVYKNEQKLGFVKKNLLSVVYTVAFIFLISAILVLLVFGTRFAEFVSNLSPGLEKVADVILGLRGGVFLVLMTAIFLIAYKSLSRKGMPIRSHFGGAVFSAIGWLIFSFAFSFYVDRFARYSYIYGSLTAMIVFMLWLYICMIIFLVGAELNMWLYSQGNEKT